MSETIRRLVIGMTGASGQIYGIRMLQALREDPSVETHLVISHAARVTIAHETEWTPRDVERLADAVYRADDIGAAIASGSFPVHAMAIVPCSIKTLSAVANSFADDLIHRAADVQLKEGRTLLLMVRETPLHLGHLELMAQAARLGCVIFPPVPAFYSRPRTLEEMVDATTGRMLARLGVENELYARWHGFRARGDAGEDEAANP